MIGGIGQPKYADPSRVGRTNLFDMSGVNGGNAHTAAAAGPVADGYRSAGPRLRAATVLVQIAVLAAAAEFVVGLVASAVTGWALTIDPAGVSGPIDRLQVSVAVADMVSTAAALALTSSVILVVTLLAAGVGVIRWQTAALHNLPALGAAARLSAGAAGVAWFVPVWALFGPKQVFNDLWRTSNPRRPADPSEPTIVKRVPVPAFHTLWWVLWVGATLIDVAAAVVTAPSSTVGALLTRQLSMIVVDLGLIGAGLLLLRVLIRTTRRQDRRYAARSRSTEGPDGQRLW